MKDHLLDIVQHTHGLGVIDLVKITGTDSDTQLEALAEDRSVIVQAKFKGVVAEFVGTFGMPNLGKLNTILNIPEFAPILKSWLEFLTVTSLGTLLSRSIPVPCFRRSKLYDTSMLVWLFIKALTRS